MIGQNIGNGSPTIQIIYGQKIGRLQESNTSGDFNSSIPIHYSKFQLTPPPPGTTDDLSLMLIAPNPYMSSDESQSINEEEFLDNSDSDADDYSQGSHENPNNNNAFPG